MIVVFDMGLCILVWFSEYLVMFNCLYTLIFGKKEKNKNGKNYTFHA